MDNDLGIDFQGHIIVSFEHPSLLLFLPSYSLAILNINFF